MTTPADDLKGTLLYEGQEGNYIISWEEVTDVSGVNYSDETPHAWGPKVARLSSYELETGELTGRVVLGDQLKNGTTLLGSTPGKIWLYSMDDELGLHYRNPKTLEVIETWPQLTARPFLKELTLAKPEYYLIDKFFGVDHEAGRLMLTDNSGYRYHLYPETYKVEKTEREFNISKFETEALITSADFDERNTIYFRGDPRNSISFLNKESGPSLTFLDAKFVVDHDPSKIMKRKQASLAEFEKYVQSLRDSLERTKSRMPTSKYPNQWNPQEREAHYLGYRLQNRLAMEESVLQNAQTSTAPTMDDPILSDDFKSVFVQHSNSMSDTAHWLLSRVDLRADTTWQVRWEIPLKGFYRDTWLAQEKGVFNDLLEVGSPKFTYSWAGTSGGKMVLIAQLKMLCLDMISGRIYWQVQL
jgi:hypothetical protein